MQQKKKLSLATQIFIALVAGVDSIFDMGRTTANIPDNACCSIIVSNMEKKREAGR